MDRRWSGVLGIRAIPVPRRRPRTSTFNVQVYFHKLGTKPCSDALALGSHDGLERVSEVFLDNRFGLPAITAMVQRGDGNVWAACTRLQAGPSTDTPRRLFQDGIALRDHRTGRRHVRNFATPFAEW